jgi:hypothetical protein
MRPELTLVLLRSLCNSLFVCVCVYVCVRVGKDFGSAADNPYQKSGFLQWSADNWKADFFSVGLFVCVLLLSWG